MADRDHEHHLASSTDSRGVDRLEQAELRGSPLTRRELLKGAIAATGVSLSLAEAQVVLADHPDIGEQGPDVVSDTFEIAEIKSVAGTLRATITVRDGMRAIPADDGTEPLKRNLRYLEGKDSSGKVVWPPTAAAGSTPPAASGPTLRARVGDRVEITLLNHIDVSAFGKAGLDTAETGISECDTVVQQSGALGYPQRAGDVGPNCFHASSTLNIHFHGTHVTPDGLGDNVLLQLRPGPQITEASVRNDFRRIFAAGPPNSWNDLPSTWRDRQLRLLKDYDDSAVWQGKRGTRGNPTLPLEHQLLPHTEATIRAGRWPIYQIGAYPYCFDLTRQVLDGAGNPKYLMEQCPGTHWYHAHKHGSTAINVLNGMAGVFIIEGDYDDTVRRVYPGITERVLLIQNLAERPNLMRTSGAPPSLRVNGRIQPTLTAKRGEVQLWRFVNASIRAVTTLLGFEGDEGATADQPQIRQLAQDGVQFNLANFKNQPFLPYSAGKPRNNFAPGNRVDLLVKAPDKPGTYTFKLVDTTSVENVPFGEADKITLLNLEVSDGSSQNMAFESLEKDFPVFPDFLGDIKEDQVKIWRRLNFGWNRGGNQPGPDEEGKAPRFDIDSRQFKGDRYDQTMVQDDVEEWRLINSTRKIAHPFHIHVNPFQVVEINDPNAATRYKPLEHRIWQDVVAIPPSKFDDSGNLVDHGYVVIRQRFADFPGSFVLHCHMLAHEDRGMMQLVRVVSSKLSLPHH